MSEGKAGTVTIGPVGIAAGGVAAAAALVVGGVAAGMVAAVNAYRAQRERIEREREQATSEQKKETSRLLDDVLQRLASSYTQQSESAPNVRTTDEILAGSVAGLPKSTDLEDGELLAALQESEQLQAPPPKVKIPVDPRPLQELISNLQGLLAKVTFALPAGIREKVKMLYDEENIDKAANLAREIRIKLVDELTRIEGEKREAKEVLESLPPDFPAEARALLSDAAEGLLRFDEEIKATIVDAQKKLQAVYRLAAAKILNDCFTEMGYVIEPVGESLFTKGGEVYFRKGEWEDGYCVKLKVEGDKVKFFLQKTAGTSDEYDRDMTQEWKTQFTKVRERLLKADIDVNVREINALKGRAIPPEKNIPINTRKTRPAEAGGRGESVTVGANKARMEKRK